MKKTYRRFYGWNVSNGYPDCSFKVSCSKCDHTLSYHETSLDPNDIPRICPGCGERLVPKTKQEEN